jgi:3-oxoacyl-[acyl-carrier protein] reductase
MGLGLQDRVALITGASRGIGYAIAEALQDQGARVALIARDEDALKSAAATLPAPGPDDVLVLANTVVLLASDLATYTTGSVLEVDGGLSKAVL